MYNSEFRAEPNPLTGGEIAAQHYINRLILAQKEVVDFRSTGVVRLKNKRSLRLAGLQYIWLQAAMGLDPSEDSIQITRRRGQGCIEVNHRGHERWGVYSEADFWRVSFVEADAKVGESMWVVGDSDFGRGLDRALLVANQAHRKRVYNDSNLPQLFDESSLARVEDEDLIGKSVVEVRFDFSKKEMVARVLVGEKVEPVDGIVIHNGVLVPKRFGTPLSVRYWGINPDQYYKQFIPGQNPES